MLVLKPSPLALGVLAASSKFPFLGLLQAYLLSQISLSLLVSDGGPNRMPGVHLEFFQPFGLRKKADRPHFFNPVPQELIQSIPASLNPVKLELSGMKGRSR